MFVNESRVFASPVETDPPFNLSYIMMNESHCGSCRSIMLSWMYPVETQVREGWITLVYELRYRNLAQPDTWKVRPSTIVNTDVYINHHKLCVI